MFCAKFSETNNRSRFLVEKDPNSKKTLAELEFG